MKLTAILLTTLICLSATAQQTDTLTNEKVIKLYAAGFSKDVLKSKIHNSTVTFDVSFDGMLKLKKAGIPDDIIDIMIANPGGGSSSTYSPNTSVSQSSHNERKIKLGSGIYYKSPSEEYQEIEPSILTNTKSNNAAQYFISGLINAKVKASLSDKQSSFVIYESLPKLIFVFDTTFKNNLNNDNNSWFANVRSPKELLLVKLTVNKNSREITIGKGNAVSSDFGIDDKSIIHFTAKKLSNGVYEVVPESPFFPGEYCLMFAQGIRQGQSSKVFDFSIRQAKGF
jgi:hypothetical protein